MLLTYPCVLSESLRLAQADRHAGLACNVLLLVLLPRAKVVVRDFDKGRLDAFNLGHIGTSQEEGRVNGNSNRRFQG